MCYSLMNPYVIKHLKVKKIKINVSYKESDTRLNTNDEITIYGDFRGLDGSCPSIASRYYDVNKSANRSDDNIVR